MADTYQIDGKDYTVEVKGNRNAVNQTLVINGQEISLTSGEILDNSGKTGLGMHLRITAKGNNVELGDGPYDYAYKGPSKEEIYAVMKERVERGQATAAERLAVYQQQYNNMAKAEALANGKTENDADLLKLTEAQIQGQEALPDIKKRFPWAYATDKSVIWDKLSQYWDNDAGFRVKCRESLKETEKMPWFDTMQRRGDTIRIKDQLAQNDTHDALSNQRRAVDVKGKVSTEQEIDSKTERLVAAANSKTAQKETKENKETNLQTKIINRSSDHDRA